MNKYEMAIKALTVLDSIDAHDAHELEIFFDDHKWENPHCTAKNTWKDIHAGEVYFVCENGWKFIVFNDCDSWDYVDTIVAPDVTKLDFDWIYENCRRLAYWRPNNPKKWTDAKSILVES